MTILQKEKGLDTIVEDSGKSFSLGSKQILSLARALIRGSEILLIDEGTSNLDEKTEKMIESMFKKDLKDKTVIFVTHNLENLPSYDRVMLVEKGAISFNGSPAEILNEIQIRMKS